MILEDLEGPDVVTTLLVNGEREEWESEAADMMTEGRGWNDELWGWKKGPRAKEDGRPLESANVTCKALPVELAEGNSPADIVTSAKWCWFQTSGCQQWKSTNVCCFKSLDWWWFVTAAIGGQGTPSWSHVKMSLFFSAPTVSATYTKPSNQGLPGRWKNVSALKCYELSYIFQRNFTSGKRFQGESLKGGELFLLRFVFLVPSTVPG